MTKEFKEQRHFRRIPFDTRVILKNDNQEWCCHLVDISLQGALVEVKDPWTESSKDQYTLEFLQSGTDVLIHMDVSIKHVNDKFLGLQVKHIDLESISHLKRLVELNLGSGDAINRELTELGKQMTSD